MKRRILCFIMIALLTLCGCGSAGKPSVPETAAAASSEKTAGTSAEAEPVTSETGTSESETRVQTTAEPETTEPQTSSEPETTARETLPEYNAAGKRLIDNRDPEDGRPALAYTFQPHVFSDLDVRVYGEEIREIFFAYCDAVLAGEDSFPCPDEKSLDAVMTLQRRLFPLGIFVSCGDPDEDNEESLLADGRCPLTYLISKEEFLQRTGSFKQCIADLIAEADLREGDSDLEKAMKLYTMLSLRTLYDYAAMEDDNCEIELSPYRTLTSGWGICQEIAPAYAYLLLQAGIEANTCGGLAKDVSFAHEWTLVRIGGTYYHADVTYQLNTPYSLQYFLTTDDERDEQNMDVEYFNIGDSNLLWHKDLPITEETFRPLWSAAWYRIDHEAKKILYLPDWELEGELTEVPASEKLLEQPFE